MATGFFAGAAFFFVTPVGLLALVAVAFFGPLFAPVFAVARFFGAAVVVSGTVGNTLGREFPACEFQHRSPKLRAEPYQKLVATAEGFEQTNRSPNEYLREPLYPVKELVKIVVVGDCDDLAHFEDASREGDNATITWQYTYGL